METFSFSNWKTVIYYLLCLRSVIYIKAVIFLWFWHIIRFFRPGGEIHLYVWWSEAYLWHLVLPFTQLLIKQHCLTFIFDLKLHTTICLISIWLFAYLFPECCQKKKHLLFFFNLGVSGKYSFLLNYDPLWVEASYIAYYIIGLYCAKVSINCILSLLPNWFLSVFIMTVYVLFDVLCTKTTQQSAYYKALKLTPTLVWNIRPII